jgi:hypothetical protein
MPAYILSFNIAPTVYSEPGLGSGFGRVSGGVPETEIDVRFRVFATAGNSHFEAVLLALRSFIDEKLAGGNNISPFDPPSETSTPPALSPPPKKKRVMDLE